MKFKPNTRRSPLEYEKDLVTYWQTHKTFEKSVSMRPASDAYVFYDGPPFITGVPHHGTLLSSIVKDAVPRYWTMKGKRVERVWGWDCHGLPAEVYTERKLGIKSKQDVYKIGLETYINTCRQNMVQTGSEWEDTIERIGRWVDFKGAYKTMDKPYMESVWWAFKSLYDGGKIYEGEKVLMYCIRDATPISKAEVAMDNSYQEDTDPSVYAKFKLKGSDSYLLVWTTVAWTLLANTALVVNQDFDYVEVEVDGQKFILAKKLVSQALRDDKHQPVAHKVLRTFKGSELVGKAYEPFYKDWGKGAHTIHNADFVTLEEGTGVVSQAPAYGEEDYMMAKQAGFPVVTVIDDYGILTESDWQGQQVWEANKEIAKTLFGQGKVWRIEYITHSYPHCHRCGTKLIYRAHPSWFMNVSDQRQEMLELNGGIHWFPEHIKQGRFTKTVESAPDWNISRDRFWATAMPVWKGTDKDGKEHVRVVGSYAELKELSGVELEDYHRPWVDDITFELDGITYKRIDKVMDSWFESGSMPFAQFHYPFENQEKFEQNFPGDFIAEYVGQVRAWFYYLHAMSTGLFQSQAFKNVIVTGTLAGNDGRKMSKSFGNYTDPNILMDEYSADALRFLLLSSPVLNGEDFSLVDKDVADVQRKLAMIWNMYDFFTLYASVDGWQWDGKLDDPTPDATNPLDQWIISRVHQLSTEIDTNMQAYDIPNAVAPVLPFIDDASNWYVRRSRRRFWKSENDGDKQMAYRTLHYVLVKLAIAMAPFTPFLAEELYRQLTGGESVHLLDWPEAGHVNDLLLKRMDFARQVITDGLAQRAEVGIKVRQPLRAVAIKAMDEQLGQDKDRLAPIILEELNVKELTALQDGEAWVVLDTKLTAALKDEGVMRELVRFIQNARKEAKLNVEDHIHLGLQTESKKLKEVIDQYQTVIKAETLTQDLKHGQNYAFETNVKIGDLEVKIGIEKA